MERVAEELMGRRRWRQYQAHILGASSNLGESATAWEKAENPNQQSSGELTKISSCNSEPQQQQQPPHEPTAVAGAAETSSPAVADVAVSKATTTPGNQLLLDDITELTTPKDWQPEDRCYFCDGAVHTEPSRVSLSPQPSESSQSSLDRESPTGTHLSASVPDTPPVSTLIPSFPPGGAATLSLESLSQMASSLAAMASMANPAAVNTAAQPALNPALFAPGLFPWYLSQALQEEQHPIPVVHPSEQPLDLSAKSRQLSDSTPLSLLDTSSLKVPNLDVKPIFRAKPRISSGAGRRTYTEEELQAALRDIQSGKLGTRRAAVIYGIPRSTLRNKVYKLERERERDHLLLQPTLPVVVPPSATTTACPTEETSGDEEHRTLSMEELVRSSGLDNLPATDSLRQLLQCRTEKPPNPTPSYPHIEPGLAPYISQLLGGNEQSNITELMKRMATSSNGTNGTENRGSGDENSDENVILRIPSFKPNGTESSEAPESVGSGSNSPVPNKNIGVSLRDVITKSITQKFQQNPTPSISVVDPATLMANPNPLKRLAPPTPPAGLSHHSSNSQQKQSQDDKNKQKSGKGTRPKRGKYRNYDRDSLIEAVRAVQRGEMSVHRAGSYYGVPHSTLEYKVKERHLMRPRKRDMNKTNEDKSPKLHTSAPMPTRTPPKAPTFPTPQIPNLAAMASLANGLKVPSGLYPPYQFWPNANPFLVSPELYQEQLLASHMMQRAAGNKSDTPNMTDRFFDGLIRSTLDRHPTSSEGSNRALLEQLCRGRQQTVVDLSQEEEKDKQENNMSEQVNENSSLEDVCDTETAKEKQDSTTEEGTSEEQKID
ncbi:hypothetical protein B566_EDAN001505 [Ephemera danica]|nr:hypothetical protein B566_EDAN001505 [Ephemera danica]